MPVDSPGTTTYGTVPDVQEPVLPHGSYQEALEHALTMAHLLEHAAMFLPRDCELLHRSAVELNQFSGWINHKLRISA